MQITDGRVRSLIDNFSYECKEEGGEEKEKEKEEKKEEKEKEEEEKEEEEEEKEVEEEEEEEEEEVERAKDKLAITGTGAASKGEAAVAGVMTAAGVCIGLQAAGVEELEAREQTGQRSQCDYAGCTADPKGDFTYEAKDIEAGGGICLGAHATPAPRPAV